VLLSELYEDLNEQTEYNNFTRPNFVYLKPNGFNNINPDSPLGIGVCDNAKNTLKFINDAYDEFHWEVKQGKRRIMVSDHFVRKDPDELGRMRERFDDETDIYLAVHGDMDKMVNQDLTFPIRSRNYIETINKMLSTLEMQTGLSAGTFTFDAQGVKTATEIVSRDSTTYRTRNSHLVNVEQFIKELIQSITELASETIGLGGSQLYSGNIPTSDDITISFDDGVFTSREQELAFVQKADAMGAIPLIQKIMKIWELDEETAKEWASQLQAEAPQTTEQTFDNVFGTRE
jgi:A118 family predicted phage portal protein